MLLSSTFNQLLLLCVLFKGFQCVKSQWYSRLLSDLQKIEYAKSTSRAVAVFEGSYEEVEGKRSREEDSEGVVHEFTPCSVDTETAPNKKTKTVDEGLG